MFYDDVVNDIMGKILIVRTNDMKITNCSFVIENKSNSIAHFI